MPDGQRTGFDDFGRRISAAGDRYSEKGRRALVGKYLGLVINNEDPKKRNRIKAEIPQIIDETPWAYPAGMGQGKDQGDVTVPDVGEVVFIEFLSGHIDHPIWTPGPYSEPGDRDTPAQGVRAETDIKKKPGGDDIMKAHKNFATKRHGFVVEMDGNSGQEKLRLFDETTGSQVRIDRKRKTVLVYSAGDIHLECKGTLYIRADTMVDIDSKFVYTGHGAFNDAARKTDGSTGATEVGGGGFPHNHSVIPANVKIAEGSDHVKIGNGGKYRKRKLTL